MSLSTSLSEAHFCKLSSQSNVYGLAKFTTSLGNNKIIAASLRGGVISMEYITVKGKLSPFFREIDFTYIPGDAEIISIDAFSKPSQSQGVVIGITFIKDIENNTSQFLNIYSDWEPDADFNLDNIAKSCHSIELQYMPYHLYHAQLCNGKMMETVFLLSGSDQKVHLFQECKYSHTFEEQSTQIFFPEFITIPSSIIWMDIKYFDNNKKRITAFCCQDGYVQVVVVKTETKEILKCWSVQHDGTATSVKLFSLTSNVECPAFILAEHMEGKQSSVTEEFHLLVTSALEPAVVYRDLLDKGLSDVLVLPESDHYDSVLCSCVTDIDFDGQNEVLLGTYGQELLFYKYVPDSKSRSSSKENSPSRGIDNSNESQSQKSQETTQTKDIQTQDSLPLFKQQGSYKLIKNRSFSFPLLSLEQIDLTGDGLYELAVLSLKGLHILQHNLQDVAKLCLTRLKQEAPDQDESDFAFEQLITEDLEDLSQITQAGQNNT